MRSLLLASSFRPALGGMETLLYETTRRLAEPPLVIAPAPARAPDMNVLAVPDTLAGRLAYRPLWRAHPALYYVATFWAPAVRAIEQTRPRVLHVGHVYLAPLGRMLARRFGLPYVVYVYGQEVWRSGQRVGIAALDARLRGRALATADTIFSPGSFTTGLLRDWRVPVEKVVGVPYGAEPRPPAAPAEGKTVLSVARLVPRKGIDTVIRALPLVDADVTYRVVGGGPDEARLRALARSEGVAERVTFLGRVDDATLEQEYQRSALFALLSRRTADGELEGLGLVYLEAAAWGRPVLAGRSGGEIDAVVDGETGILVDGDSVADVARALNEVLRDPARLRALGEAGRRRLETSHNWTLAARVVDQTLSRLA